jgi:hypothetical protein
LCGRSSEGWLDGCDVVCLEEIYEYESFIEEHEKLLVDQSLSLLKATASLKRP